jgi:hypothetical protein
MATEVGNTTLYSVEDLLSRSKAAAESGSTAGMSKIQKMIAEMEKGTTDTVNLSPVARLLKQEAAAKPDTSTPYTEQDWYINAKVAQLQGQLNMYSTLPGLDPSGAIMQSLEDEIYGLVESQQAKLKKSQDEAAAKQAELDKLNAEKANAPLSAEKMLERSKTLASGQEIKTELTDAAKKLLDKYA